MQTKYALVSGAFLVLFLAACTPAPQYKDYYVSVLGSDTTGSGTQAKPWRHIQYTIDHATVPGVSTTLRINLAKGLYNENIVINGKEVIITGAGSTSEAISSPASNPELTNQEVSVIVRQNDSDKYCYELKAVDVINGGDAKLENLNVFWGGVTATDSKLSLENVVVNNVLGLNPDVGCYGVKIINGNFSILNSRIETQEVGLADYGLHVIGSGGFFTNSYVGNGFDHAINITAFDVEIPTWEFLQNLPPPANIYISEAIIEGSYISYADGVRFEGPVNVVIRDTTITRATGGEAPHPTYNLPHAALDIKGSMFSEEMVADVGSQIRRIEVINVQMSGFDVGIGVNIATFELKVEDSNIQGLTYGVETMEYDDPIGSVFPTVDFGGGPLGSKGNNIFSNQPKYAYYHYAPYDVWACYNKWNVMTNQIDSLRILDKLDVPTFGRVQWNCSSSGAATSQSGLTIVTPTQTVTPQITTLVAIPLKNANCRLGNSASMFDIVDTLYQGQQYSAIGIGSDKQWVAFIGPVYGARCWVYFESLTLLLNDEETEPGDIPETYLPVLNYPPLPTPTFTPESEEPEEPETEPEPDRPQCSDGIDNDGDGLIDMADGRCLTPDGDFEG